MVLGCRKGIATDRLVGFQDLGGKDDFSTKALEILFTKKGDVSIRNTGVYNYQLYRLSD